MFNPDLSLIDRMHDALIDIIDMCNTDACTWRAGMMDADWMKLVEKINEVAHRGLYGWRYWAQVRKERRRRALKRFCDVFWFEDVVVSRSYKTRFVANYNETFKED